MTVYHISQTLRAGNPLDSGHGGFDRLAEPFLQALNMGEDWLRIMLLQGKYLLEVMQRSSLREWADYAKWSTEAVFEHVRRREFPHRPSRLHCCFYYESIEQCRRFYHEDWDGERPEVRSGIRLLAVALDDPAPARFDMNLYDMAYEAMEKRQDLGTAMKLANRYFSGEGTAEPVWEILSACPAMAVRELSSGDQIDYL